MASLLQFFQGAAKQSNQKRGIKPVNRTPQVPQQVAQPYRPPVQPQPQQRLIQQSQQQIAAPKRPTVIPIASTVPPQVQLRLHQLQNQIAQIKSNAPQAPVSSQGVLNIARSFVTQPAAEVAASVTNRAVRPTNPVTKALLGNQPVKPIQQDVKGVYQAVKAGHQNLPGGIPINPKLAVPYAVADAILHGANDLPLAGAAGKVAKIANEAKIPLGANKLSEAGVGAVGKNVNKGVSSRTTPAKSGLVKSQSGIVPDKSLQPPKNLQSSSNVITKPQNVKIGTRSIPKTIRQSQTVQANTPIPPAEVHKIFQDIPYFKQVQKHELAKASDEIKTNPIKAVNEALNPSPMNLTSHQIARRTTLLADALRRGDAGLAEGISKALAPEGTKLGQAVSMFQTINRTTPSGAFHWASQLGADSGTAQNFYKRAIEVSKMKSGLEQNIARYKLGQDIASLDPSPAGKQAVELWRSMLLTAPKTHGGNILSNTIEAATKQLGINPVATAFDIPTKLFTGQRSRALTGKGLISGAGEGLSSAKTYIKTGYNPLNPAGKYEAAGTVFSKNKAGKIAKGLSQPVYRVLGAADQPFRLSATRQALQEQAKVAAINKGIKGAERRQFIKDFMARPPRSAQEHATAQGASSVFGDKTILGDIAGKLKQPVTINGKQVYSGAAGQFVVPFSQVPSSIATRILKRSPLGYLSAAKDIVNAARGKGFDQYMFTQKLADATVGSAGSLVVGKVLSDHNMITLGYPTDKKEQELWKLEGKQQYSIKVGNKWISLNYVQPFGSMLAWGAGYQQAIKQGKSPQEAATVAVAQAGKAVTGQSFLQGVSGALGAVQDPVQNAATYVQNAARSSVPNIIGTATRSFDPTQRQVNSPIEAVQQGIPGLRQKLLPKKNVYGGDIKRPTSALNSLLSPLSPSDTKSDPVTKELRRLQDSSYGVTPQRIDAGQTIGGNKVNLNPKQINDLQTITGQQTQKLFNQTINSKEYKSLSDADKQNLLQNISNKAAELGRAEFATQNNISLNKKLSAKATQIAEGKFNVADFLKKNGSKGSTAKLPKSTNTVFDPTTNTYTQTSSTGKVTKISADGTRTVVQKGLGKISGANPDWSSQIRSYSVKHGVDPNAALAVAAMEGLGGGVGDNGTSYGPFQLHIGGALPKGKDRAWAESPAGIEYAVQQISKVAKGKKGQDAINAIVSQFERPLDPNREIAGASAIYGGKSAKLAPGSAKSTYIASSKSGRKSSGKTAKQPKLITTGFKTAKAASIKTPKGIKVKKLSSPKLSQKKLPTSKLPKISGTMVKRK